MEKGRIKIENFFKNCTCPHLTFVTGGERFEIQMYNADTTFNGTQTFCNADIF